jgi:diguanylate cyclase (GGDEF)-like protein
VCVALSPISPIVRFFSNLRRPTVRSRREMWAFVTRTVIVCVAVALGVDVANQMIFFVDWPTSIRSWAITIVLAGSIAAVVSWLIARAHHELYQAKLQVDLLSRTDPMTGLPNRRAVFEVAETATPDAMALVIVDIDRFKRVNDTHGHLAGDEVIRTIAEIMAGELGHLGCVGRIGGEEFALVGSGIDCNDLAERLFEFCRRVAGTPIVVNGGAVVVTVSAGVALRRPGGSFADLYAEADRALYDAKTQGRNRVCFGPSFPAVAEDWDGNERRWREDADPSLPSSSARSVA